MNTDASSRLRNSDFTTAKSNGTGVIRPDGRADRERLELQARRVAGSLVLVGVALGLFVNPYGFGLSALIGVGLILSGITGACPMATLLGKIPGNSCCSPQPE